jgi:pyruvate/2-oxoglutarate dehydrogenase complex dihydrolipoamide dehydrogenase (E3) component
MAARYDLVIVGMGSGGMVAAEFAATLGIRVAVVERHRVGGDCLWTGCVPSKALLASAKAAHTMRTADRFGLDPVTPAIDTGRVWARIRAIQNQIAATDDNADRFRDMGLEVRVGDTARLTSPTSVQVDGEELQARFILLCTGSRPAVPELEGLAEAGYLTSENVFELERAPRSVAFVGGGPISIELAQGFRRLGTEATVLQKGDRILPRDEPDLVAALVDALEHEGVRISLDVLLERVTVENGLKVLHGTHAGDPRAWQAEEILVGAGRRPNVEGLGLEEVGVEVGPRGVTVDDALRTTASSVYACGDVAGRFLFTHSAGYEAVRAVRNMFFPARAKGDYPVPWCTFTDPEIAHAGLTTAQAIERHGEDHVEVFRRELSHSDRARAESAEAGAIVIVTARRKVVGAHILAPAAGELIHELALAMREEVKLADLAGMIHVYPTLATSIQQLAGEASFKAVQRYSWLVRRSKGATGAGVSAPE